MYFVNFANILNNFVPSKYSKYGYNMSKYLLKFEITENDHNAPLPHTEHLGIISYKLKNLFTLQSIEKIGTCLILNLFQMKNNFKIQTFTNL